jgi:hypothetical protein
MLGFPTAAIFVLLELEGGSADLDAAERRGGATELFPPIGRWKTTLSPGGSHLSVNTNSVCGLGPCWTG